jgi:hypothetical protein
MASDRLSQEGMLSSDITLINLENIRQELINIVNTNIDRIKNRIEKGEAPIDLEIRYPLNMEPHFYKGKKPTAVFFGEEEVEAKTWRTVYSEILRRCALDPDKYVVLKNLCNKITGRKRTFLSDKPDGMNVPIKIGEGLYAEGYIDTEWLLRILTKEILNVVKYDYRDITVTLRF